MTLLKRMAMQVVASNVRVSAIMPLLKRNSRKGHIIMPIDPLTVIAFAPMIVLATILMSTEQEEEHAML
jgi:hypothetical protein